MIKIIAILVTINAMIFSIEAFAEEFYDYNSGEYLDFNSTHNNLEVYNYSTHEYRDVVIDNVRRHTRSTEVEVYDYSTGEYSTYDLEP